MSELTSAAIAERYGVSERTARRWLADAHARHGDALVAHRGRRLVTTEAAWSLIAPAAGGDEGESERTARLEARVDDLEAFQRRAIAWFRRLGVAVR